jgi:hypothetical protein
MDGAPTPSCAVCTCRTGKDTPHTRCNLEFLPAHAGDVGLEIAPGNEVEDLKLIEDVGNIWNHVPVAREWTPLDPR